MGRDGTLDHFRRFWKILNWTLLPCCLLLRRKGNGELGNAKWEEEEKGVETSPETRKSSWGLTLALSGSGELALGSPHTPCTLLAASRYPKGLLSPLELMLLAAPVLFDYIMGTIVERKCMYIMSKY